MDLRILLLVCASALAKPSKNNKVPPTNCGYQTCHPINSSLINVHIVPHSHDDVGRLKTFDQYYYGTKRDVAEGGVQYILTSVIEALKANADRRFIQVETAFLKKWWNDQDDATKLNFTQLVNNGQIEIVNGAWSMNDEAAANYQSIIDDFTWGLRFLNDTLGGCARPKFGWQIDPFGHSREHASLLKQLGYEGLFVGRIDYRDKEKRRNDKTLDFLWQSSANLGNPDVFTSMFPELYDTPQGFCWDMTCKDDAINDLETSPGYNVKQIVQDFAKKLDTYATYYQTKNILFPLGGDFQYQAAGMNFANADKLIKGFANHDKYNLIYSTPSCYVKAVNDEATKARLTLKKKTNDFFPYGSSEHSLSTGYYTSRPTIKRFERVGNNIFQAFKQLTTYSQLNGKVVSDLLVDFYEAMGTIQHHDAITGTERQSVAEDYVRTLYNAIQAAHQPAGSIIGNLLKKKSVKAIDLKLSTCLSANISVCDASSKPDRFVVAVYNPLSHNVHHHVRLPVDVGTYKITGHDGEEPSDVLDSISTFDYVNDSTPSPKELLFAAKDVPALGVKLYYVEKISSKLPSRIEAEALKDDDGSDLTFGDATKNGFTIDGTTKLLKTVTINGKALNVAQEFFYYDSFATKENEQSSGAYAFRPASQDAKAMRTAPLVIKQHKGNVVDEVKQVYDNANGKLTQIIRVYKGDEDSYIEFDWLVGELVVDKEKNIFGKEVITRFTVENFANKGLFYTDSNGREMLKRQVDKRDDYTYDGSLEPVSGNYYPVTSKITIKDDAQKLQVSVLNDRAQGGSSLKDGVVELMVHRRVLTDDGFGLVEPLDETEYGKGLYVRGQHFLTFGSSESGGGQTAFERRLARRKLLAPLNLVGDASGDDLNTLQKAQSLLEFSFAGFMTNLQDNVEVLTLQPWKDGKYLLRLEHTLEKGEDDSLSTDVTVNLKGLFTKFGVAAITETTLGANQNMEDFLKEKKFAWTPEQQAGLSFEDMTALSLGINKELMEFEREKKVSSDKLKIKLSPMQIRTFVIKAGPPDKKGKGGGRNNEPLAFFVLVLVSVYVFIF